MSAIQPQVTARILDLLRTAEDALNQAEYEGSHYLRQDPAPSTDSPWQRPDLPDQIARDLRRVIRDLEMLRLAAGSDYERANGIVHMRYVCDASLTCPAGEHAVNCPCA
jgi:hypothetical protein